MGLWLGSNISLMYTVLMTKCELFLSLCSMFGLQSSILAFMLLLDIPQTSERDHGF